MTEPPPSSSLDPAPRHWRLLHRAKQTRAAELLGVTQPTISRWESSTQTLLVEERTRLEHLLDTRLEAAADQALTRLTKASPQPVYLTCDLTRRLLVCSPVRATQFDVSLGELFDRPLWPYCSEEILYQEATLGELGQHEPLAPPALELTSRASALAIVSIRRSRCRWTRITLLDGRTIRLVETL